MTVSQTPANSGDKIAEAQREYACFILESPDKSFEQPICDAVNSAPDCYKQTTKDFYNNLRAVVLALLTPYNLGAVAARILTADGRKMTAPDFLRVGFEIGDKNFKSSVEELMREGVVMLWGCLEALAKSSVMCLRRNRRSQLQQLVNQQGKGLPKAKDAFNLNKMKRVFGDVLHCQQAMCLLKKKETEELYDYRNKIAHNRGRTAGRPIVIDTGNIKKYMHLVRDTGVEIIKGVTVFLSSVQG